MIIWINGPFGAGKTTLAKRLRDRRSKSLIFDPEEIGFVVKETVPMYKTIQPIKPPSAERHNDCQAQYFSNANKPPIKTGHVPMPYHLNFRRPFGCQN